jgi:alpha/beta superfamily hydrolase
MASAARVIAAALLFAAGQTLAAESVTFETEDGAEIHADFYRGGDRGVILAHGARYTRASWEPQAKELRARGFTVLAPDFRGFGKSQGPGKEDPLSAPLYQDLLAAARYLRAQGVRSVSIVGASLGGMAAGDALLRMKPGEIDRVVFLGSRATLSGGDLSKMPGRKLFIVARDDVQGTSTLRLAGIREDYEAVPEPRELVVVEGAAHAQALFDTVQGPDVFTAIERFLGAD